MSLRGQHPIKILLSFHVELSNFDIIFHYKSPEYLASRSIFLFPMGNCQAIEAAALVIQHASGELERRYWPVEASEIMRLHRGHHVALIIPLHVSDRNVRFTRVKILRPSEMLELGHAYRLLANEDVMKAKTKKLERIRREEEEAKTKVERRRRGPAPATATNGFKTWQPSLQSISESTV